MSKHNGNFEVYGDLVVGANISGSEYTIPHDKGDTGEALLMDSGIMIFANPAPYIDIAQTSGGAQLIENVNQLLLSILDISGTVDNFTELFDTPKPATVINAHEGEIIIVDINASIQAQKIAYSGVTIGDIMSDIASVSGDLQAQIDAITVPTSATFLNDYDARYVNEIDLIVTLGNYTLLSTTASISGDLQAQIDAITVPTSATFLNDYDNRYVNVTGDTMTGQLVGISGSASVPSFATLSGAGIFSAAANSMSIATSGVERARVFSDGSVQIGGPYTTSPSAGNLSVPGSGTDSERFGAGSQAAGLRSQAFGKNAVAGATDSIAVGFNASTDGSVGGIAIGTDATIPPGGLAGSIAIGDGARAFNGISIGFEAGKLWTSGNGIFIGKSAGDAITNANGSVGIGENALGASTTGSSNTAIGTSAGRNITTSTFNVAVGFTAGTGNGQRNVAIGAFAGDVGGAVTASDSTYIGASSGGQTGTSGNSNTALGAYSFNNPVTDPTGGENVAIGVHAAGSLTTASRTVFVGAQAGDAIRQLGTASNSIAIGYEAVTTGIGGIAIGYRAAAGVDELVIGSPTQPMRNVYFGSGADAIDAETVDVILHGSDVSGSNFNGKSFAIAGGRGTGTGVGGHVKIMTAPAGGSGAVKNALVDRVWFYNDGGVQIGGTFVAGPGPGALLLGNPTGGSAGIKCIATGALTPTILTLPTVNATAGQVLGNDGAGVLSWVSGTSLLAEATILLPTTSARNVIHPSGAAIIPLTIKGFAAQSANLQVWQDSTATVLASISATGGATFSAAVNTAQGTLTDAGSITTNAALANAFTVTLGGNRTLANPTNLAAGSTYIWRITQDGGGSRTLAYGSVFAWSGGTAPTLTTAPGSVDIITGYYDGTKLNCNAMLNMI